MKIPLKLKKEDELLIYLARTSLNPETEKKINTIINKRINWNYLLQKASAHGLRPLIYTNLKKYPKKVPEEVMSLLKNHFFINTNKNLLFLAETLKILKTFQKNNIDTIPYKGPIMAVHGYGNLSLREFGDLDLYIDKKDFSKVKEILIQNNYKSVLKLNNSREAEYLKNQREYKFKNIENNITLEIQWNTAGFSFTFPKESIFPLNKDDYQLIPINNQHVKIFSDEDLILILTLHLAGHLWSRLSWICDIAELIKKSEEINWNKIIKKAQDLAVERILYLNLLLCQVLFDIKLPENVQNRIKEDEQIEKLEKKIFKLIFTPEKFSLLSKVLLRFKIRENKLNGFKDIWRIITIPQSDEWTAFENKQSTILSYILKRPAQIIKRLKE